MYALMWGWLFDLRNCGGGYKQRQLLVGNIQTHVEALALSCFVWFEGSRGRDVNECVQMALLKLSGQYLAARASGCSSAQRPAVHTPTEKNARTTQTNTRLMNGKFSREDILGSPIG